MKDQENRRHTLPATLIAMLSVLATASAAQDQTDLTGVVLQARDTDCAAYAGDYTSTSTDLITGTAFEGSLAIVSDDTECTFTVNQIPNHNVGEGANWPHQIGEVPQVLTVTRTPTIADAPSSLGLGASAILLNGIKWEAYPAACFGVGDRPAGRETIGCGPSMIDHPWRYNVGSSLNDSFSFDSYHAHVQNTGLYHYHSTPRVLYTATRELATDADCAGNGVSPVIGFASDGFPLFGPCFTDETGTIRAAQSSYQLKSGIRADINGYETPYTVGNVKSDDYNGQFVGDYEFVDGTGDLDACNGMEIDGQYGYFVTVDYPYAIKCLSGTPSAQFP